jgi:DNA-binding transcriptional regulator YiaG
VVGVVVLGADKCVEAAFANGAVIDVGQAIGGSHRGKIEIRKECCKPENAAGKITARTHQLTARAASFSGEEIAAIRKNLNVSQAVFADLLNVPKATAVAWERGLRSPSGAAMRLLQIAKNRPNALLETVAQS